MRKTIAALFLTVAAAVMPAPVHANSIIVDFAGSAAGLDVPFTASVTWGPDSTYLSFLPPDLLDLPNASGTYGLDSWSFVLDGVDMSDRIEYGYLYLLNGYLGDPEDHLLLVLDLEVGITLERDDGYYHFSSTHLVFTGPSTMLTSGRTPIDGTFAEVGVPVLYFPGCATPGQRVCYDTRYSELSSVTVTAVPTPVPEPASVVLLGLGLTGLAARRAVARRP